MSRTSDVFYRHDESNTLIGGMDMIVSTPLFTSCTPAGFADSYNNTKLDDPKTEDLQKRLNDLHNKVLKQDFIIKSNPQYGGEYKSEVSSYKKDSTISESTYASKYFPEKTSEFSSSVYTSQTSAKIKSQTEDLPYDIDSNEMMYEMLKDDIKSDKTSEKVSSISSPIKVKNAPINEHKPVIRVETQINTKKIVKKKAPKKPSRKGSLKKTSKRGSVKKMGKKVSKKGSNRSSKKGSKKKR